MDEKNIIAIQYIHLESKQRVPLQKVFLFINKGALITKCDLPRLYEYIRK